MIRIFTIGLFALLGLSLNGQTTYPPLDSASIEQVLQGKRDVRWNSDYHRDSMNRSQPMKAIKMIDLIKEGGRWYATDSTNLTTIRSLDTVYFKGVDGVTVRILPGQWDTIEISGSGITPVPDTSGTCGCCNEDMGFYVNDDSARVDGINNGQYYFLSEDNSYGMAWGLVKISTEVGALTAVKPPGCLDNSPEGPFEFFDSDTDAIAGGLSVGEFYLLSSSNVYAMAAGLLKMITEP